MSGSGSAVAVVVLVLGLVLGLLLAQPSLDRALSDLKDARQGVSEELMGMKNTDLSISNCSFNTTTGTLSTVVLNEGAAVIPIDQMDILVNGTLKEHEDVASAYLYPQDMVVLKVKGLKDPRSVRLVGPWGVSDQTEDITRT